MPELKRPKPLTIQEEEIVCHRITQTCYSPAVCDAEVRIVIHTDDGRVFETVTNLELYERD